MIIISSVLDSVIGLSFMAIQKKDLKAAIPFGPFLAIGAFVYQFWGEALIAHLRGMGPRKPPFAYFGKAWRLGDLLDRKYYFRALIRTPTLCLRGRGSVIFQFNLCLWLPEFGEKNN